MFAPHNLTAQERTAISEQVLSVTAQKGAGRRRKPRPPLDLFGQVPVTFEDCREWIARTAPRWHGARLECWYAVHYQVAAKVARDRLAARL